jgi:tetratricopeptide (TPR) repeat protein
MRVGNRNAARDDFTVAEKLQPTGQTQAAMAYSFSATGDDYHLAVSLYRSAINRDFKTAVVFNNLGYCLMCTQEGDDEAAQWFRKATQADPRLQVAYHNRATLELKKAWNHRDRLSYDDLREGLAAIARAIDLGPATAQMHLDAARLCVLAAKIEPRWKELALDHLASAIDRGLPPAHLKSDRILDPLHGARFDRLTERPAMNSTQIPPVRVLDPLEGN